MSTSHLDTQEACSHHWKRQNGCPECVFNHGVAPIIQAGNHRMMQPGVTYVCGCGARRTIAQAEEVPLTWR
jgi:hypothetical protein